ncbi:MAG TPA: ankyrin repeat domain-containing protein [Vicinamibacterales bacterium]|nr:ankyrin repeat domain-containing protein [Vicinamibacterales bacterium]
MEQQLFDAIKAGKTDEVRQLVQQNPSLKQARDASGASAILVAAYNMKPDVVNALLELGAPVDIFEASVLGKVDRINEILKSSPARVSEHAPDGFTPVALAAFFGQPAAVRALIAAGADVKAAAKNALKVQALHAAVAGRNLEIVKAVLDAGADPNAQQQAGFRPIHEAGTNANRALAELLLKHGADPTLTSDDGKNAIDLARAKGHAEFADWLAAQRPA